MGDKHRSEIQKPVKNTLLSGASHGFPFESFQGSSLLIPVSQDSPSVLNDSGNQSVPQDLTGSDNINQLTHSLQTTAMEEKPTQEDTKTPSQTSSQSYGKLFSSFFGGGGKGKQELDLSPNIQKIADQTPSQPSQRASPPFIPKVQSFSPTLQVPIGNDHSQSDVYSSSPKVPNPSESSFLQNQISLSKSTSDSASQSNSNIVESFKTSQFQDSVGPSSNSSQFSNSEIQNFFNQDHCGTSTIEYSNKAFPLFSGSFESSYPTPPNNPEVPVLLKAQSAIDLPIGLSEKSLGSTSYFGSPPPLRLGQSAQFFQTRPGSSDSLKNHSIPPSGAPSSLSAPPMSTGTSARKYRLAQNKRVGYAPIPGLTSNVVVSSSYLQPSESFSSTPLLQASTSLLPSTVLIPSTIPLTESLPNIVSQPALSGTVTPSDLNDSPSSIPASAFTKCSATQNVVETVHSSADAHVNIASSTYFSTASQISTEFVPTTMPYNQSVSPVSNFTSVAPPISGTSTIISPVAVHPPIMSTKEQETPGTSRGPPRRAPSLNNLANLGNSGFIYRPVYFHWFKLENDTKEMWQPFTMTDSLALERVYKSGSVTPNTLVPTDGGRYDVNVMTRMRTPVYWEEKPKQVRRCSWFYKSTTENRFCPYDETTAVYLEEEYKLAVTTNTWNKKIELPNGEFVVMNGPNSIVYLTNTPQTPEGWEAEQDFTQHTHAQYRSKIVKRGVLDEFEIEDGEASEVDHLIFIVHGIGSVCDLKLRNVVEAVDGFRSKTLELVKSHFRTSVEQGIVNRVEILPVSWHKTLHGETTGVDKKLQTITLNSIPKFRHFINDTLLDILFYTSPVYCQNIMQQVGHEINSLYSKFKARNPTFKGGVSIVGHSLGSLIVFDMLCHQKPPSPHMEDIKESSPAEIPPEVAPVITTEKRKRNLNRNVSYVMGNAGTGQPFIVYPQLNFQPVAFFAMGSPIGMYVTVRGIDSLGLDFCMPTCSRFFNIFHPFDPVAYRIESLINPELVDKSPVLIPHHKGRKRMHLELRETMARVGADLKQRLVDSVRSTLNTVFYLTKFGRADDGLEQEVDKVIAKQLERQTSEAAQCLSEVAETECNAGCLNQGRRIDYVLQEAPLESSFEYFAALKSHVIYWDSEDTMLLMLNEIYGSMGLYPDTQICGISALQDDRNTPSSSDYQF